MSSLPDFFKDYLNIKCKNNKAKIAEYVWKKYRKRLLFFIRNYDLHNSEDILSEIMIKIFENIDKYDANYSLGAWIFRIAKNHCLNHMKKIDRSTLLDDMSGFQSSLFQPFETTFSNVTVESIDSLINQFDSQLRQMCFLRFYENKSYKEIAAILDIKKGTVKSRLYYARNILAKKMEGKDEV